MGVIVKICGINDPKALAAATDGGADYVGFVFYPPSPRSLEPATAATLAAQTTARCVGVFVNPTDDDLSRVLDRVKLDYLQLHGGESPERLLEIRGLTGMPLIKAVPVAGPDDITAAKAYEDVADILLFDAKPPKSMADALPGGNALRFDWDLLAKADIALPWFLSGGLDAAVVAEAIRISGARAVDVSSGVEDRPGVKSAEKIAAFLKAARTQKE